MRLVIVTGVSGAGKSTALRALEDLDYYCVDNLPLPLVPKFVELLAGRNEVGRAALGIDARSGEFLSQSKSTFADIRAAGHDLQILFLDAPDETLIRRFSETRRRHPLLSTDVRSALVAERSRLAPMREEASEIVDTGLLTGQALRAVVQERHGRRAGGLALTLMSFGFKYGLPPEADIVLDVRFLPNPFFVPELAPQSGEDEAVRRFVLGQADALSFLETAEPLLQLSMRGFEKEGKSYATIAVGCTGGRHRSVALVLELRARLGRDDLTVSVRHRDLGRSA